MDKGRAKIRAVVPSSTMLFGEHAVLRSRRALVAAIDRFMCCELEPRGDSEIEIRAQGLVHRTSLEELAFPDELRFVGEAFRQMKGALQYGCTLSITSDIPHTVGLGSSASVTVAVIAALSAYIYKSASLDLQKLLSQSIALIRAVQGGVGSGADAASIIYGGVIAYEAEAQSVRRLAASIPLSLIYCGYKTPTPAVIRTVNRLEEQFPDIFAHIFDAIEAISCRAEAALMAMDLQVLGSLMNMAQGLMEAMQLSTKELSSILWSARAAPGVFGAKISGSGLGDSVVALGDIKEAAVGQLVAGKVSPNGVVVEIENG